MDMMALVIALGVLVVIFLCSFVIVMMLRSSEAKDFCEICGMTTDFCECEGGSYVNNRY